MPFQKGDAWNGNAGGRLRKTEEQKAFERKCREWAKLFALDKLKKAADSEKAGESLAAVKEILDRGFGKSEQISYVDLETNASDNLSLGLADARRIVREALAGSFPASPNGDAENTVDSGK